MGTVTYQYEPNTPVWVITGGINCPSAVRDGVALNVRINIYDDLGSPPTLNGSPLNGEILYSVLITGENGPTTFIEADVFDVFSESITEYEIRFAVPAP